MNKRREGKTVERRKKLSTFTLSQSVLDRLENFYNKSSYVNEALKLHFDMLDEVGEQLEKFSEADYTLLVGKLFPSWNTSLMKELNTVDFMTFLLEQAKSELPKELYNKFKNLSRIGRFALAQNIDQRVNRRRTDNEEMIELFRKQLQGSPSHDSKGKRASAEATA